MLLCSLKWKKLKVFTIRSEGVGDQGIGIGTAQEASGSVTGVEGQHLRPSQSLGERAGGFFFTGNEP